jgi:putative addiction module component (TIGR02574 family)
MTAEALALLENVLRLPADARAEIAGELCRSLDEGQDADAEAAWAKEIERRVADLDAGRAKTISWAESQRRIHARFGI